MRIPAAGLAMLFMATLAVPGAKAGPALLFDVADGKVLYAEDPDDQWHPASLTKMMTAYLTFEALKAGRLTLESKVTCSELAFTQQPSKVGLPVGAELTVDTALKALIVKSANDVAVMLAEAVGGSDLQFVAMMNETARRLGMTRTTFANPNGLPASEQVTTARDLAKLARAIVRDFPEHAHYWSMSDMRLGKLRLRSHNGLLTSFEGADGLKTGFICDSGFNIVASATRDGRRIMAVVLGEPTGADRTLRASSLLEHGFQNYGWKTIFNTTSIDNMPMSADARSITSMREQVVSWECGTGRRSRAVAKVRKLKSKAAKAKAATASAAPDKDAPKTAASAQGEVAKKVAADKPKVAQRPAAAPASASSSSIPAPSKAP